MKEVIFLPPNPIWCCHSCGKVHPHGGRYYVLKDGWYAQLGRPHKTKQVDGSIRLEYICECPDCH